MAQLRQRAGTEPENRPAGCAANADQPPFPVQHIGYDPLGVHVRDRGRERRIGHDREILHPAADDHQGQPPDGDSGREPAPRPDLSGGGELPPQQ